MTVRKGLPVTRAATRYMRTVASLAVDGSVLSLIACSVKANRSTKKAAELLLMLKACCTIEPIVIMHSA